MTILCLHDRGSSLCGCRCNTTPRFPTLVAFLQHWAKELPDAVAYIFLNKQLERHTLTWAHLHTLSGRFAAKLHAQGLGRGDLVVNTLPNGPERLVGEAGVWMSGAATVNGQCQLADGSDLIRTLRVSRASALLVDPDVEDSPWNVLNNHVKLVSASHHDHELTQHVECESLPELKKVFLVRRVEGRGRGDFLGDLEAGSDWFQADDLTSDDPLAVFTTSGTTGFSKLVVYTHGNYLVNDVGDRHPHLHKMGTFNLAPMGWLGGFPGNNVLTGGHRVINDFKTEGVPEDMEEFTWKGIQQEKCTLAYFPPKYLRRFQDIAKEEKERAQNGDEDEAAVWKTPCLLLGGQPVSRTMVEGALSQAQSVLIVYGGTETVLVSGMVVTDSESYIDHDTGPPAQEVQVKIVSSNDETKVCLSMSICLCDGLSVCSSLSLRTCLSTHLSVCLSVSSISVHLSV